MSNVPSVSRPASVRPPQPRSASSRPAPPRPAAAPTDDVEELRTMDVTVLAAELKKSLPPPLPSSFPPPAGVTDATNATAPAAVAEHAASDDAAPIVSPFAPPSLPVRLRAFALAAVSWTIVLGVFVGYLARAAFTWVRATAVPGLRAVARSARERSKTEWSRAKEHPSATRR